MKVTGIIAEYNPLHNGHLYQLEMAKKQTQADLVIVCMSGNYVQRGEPAIFDKWQRAQLALEVGADLVIELPFASAVQPADRFARGAVATLTAAGCHALAFGSEVVDVDYRVIGRKVSQLPKQSGDFIDYQKTYATQLNEYYQNQLGLEISQPNHLLAVSYAAANAALGEPLQLVPILRTGAQHADETLSGNPFASASAIRRQLTNVEEITALKTVVPTATWQLFQQAGPLSWAQLWPFLQYKVNSTSVTELAQIYQMSEGLEYRFKRLMPQAASFDAFIQALKSKRYTYVRLQRLCLYVVLNIQAAEMQAVEQSPYLRLLGFNAQGQTYLKHLRKNSPWPIINKVSAKSGQETGLMGLEVRIDRLIEQLTGRAQNFAKQPLFYQRKDD